MCEKFLTFLQGHCFVWGKRVVHLGLLGCRRDGYRELFCWHFFLFVFVYLLAFLELSTWYPW